MQHDIVIRGGRWFDGAGSASKVCDIGIREGRVAAIGEGLAGADVIEADGQWVMPGFIDTHTHYDAEVLVAPELGESVRHGVTTVVTGSCSLSMVRSSPLDCADMFSRVEALPREPVLNTLERVKTWSTAAGWIEHLESLALGPNVASMIGHSDLRSSVMGLGRAVDPKAKPTRAEREALCAQLEEALDAGFVGCSTMTNPWDKLDGDRYLSASLPSTYASWREYGWLHRILRRRGRILQSAPNLNTKVNLFLFFLASAPWRNGPALKTTLISAADPKASPWLAGLIAPVTGALNKLLNADLRWQALPVPFEIYADGMELVVFEEFGAGAAAMHIRDELARNELLATEAYRRRFRADFDKRFSPRIWHRDFHDAVIIACPDADLVGRSFGAIAEDRGLHPADLFLDLVVAHGSRLRWKTLIANHRPEVLQSLLADDSIQVGFADSGAHLRNMGFYNFPLHLLRMARDTGFISLEKAVAKLTGELGSWFGLDAGTLTVGDRADIAIVDPDGLDDSLDAYHEAPLSALDGVSRIVRRNDRAVAATIIGGRVASRYGELSADLGRDQRYGRFLRAGVENRDQVPSAAQRATVESGGASRAGASRVA